MPTPSRRTSRTRAGVMPTASRPCASNCCADVGVGERLHHLRVQAVDEVGRRARRQPQAEPVDDVEVLAARLPAWSARPACPSSAWRRSPRARAPCRSARAGARSACRRRTCPRARRARRSSPPPRPCTGPSRMSVPVMRLHHLGRNVARGADARRRVVELARVLAARSAISSCTVFAGTSGLHDQRLAEVLRGQRHVREVLAPGRR